MDFHEGNNLVEKSLQLVGARPGLLKKILDGCINGDWDVKTKEIMEQLNGDLLVIKNDKQVTGTAESSKQTKPTNQKIWYGGKKMRRGGGIVGDFIGDFINGVGHLITGVIILPVISAVSLPFFLMAGNIYDFKTRNMPENQGTLIEEQMKQGYNTYVYPIVGDWATLIAANAAAFRKAFGGKVKAVDVIDYGKHKKDIEEIAWNKECQRYKTSPYNTGNVRGGGDAHAYVHILGRRRKIVTKEGKQWITYDNQFILLKEAVKLDKEAKKK